MKGGLIIVAAVLLAAWTLPVAAGMDMAVTCTSGGQTLTQVFQVPANAGGGNWTLPAPVAFTGAGGETLGTIKSLDIQTGVDPFVAFNFVIVNFAVDAGASDTTFQFDSGVLNFAPMVNPAFCYASAGVTLTSDGNGATVTGLFPGPVGKTYEARYNNDGSSSILYADLVKSETIDPDLTRTFSERDPLGGYQMLLGTIYNIESHFNFTLSALDQASGTSRFFANEVPEPATLSLLALGGLALLRKRK